MTRRQQAGLLALATLDLVGGCVLLVWPGLWQELWHPRAMGTVFYPLQFTGSVWLCRGLLALVALRRPRWRLALAGMWGAEVPGMLLLAWRTASTGPWTLWFYVGRALISVGAALALWRAVPRDEN